MLIESLSRLIILQEVLQKENFNKDIILENQEIINSQIEILKKGMKIAEENPGPYVIPIKNKTINIFTPVHTQNGDWLVILYRENDKVQEELHVFHTIYELISILLVIFNKN